MTLPVLINRSGGTASKLGDKLENEIEAAFKGAGLDAAVELVEGCDIRAAVKRHIGVRTIVVGGGDGTLGCAADCLAGSDTALGILPLGTRNHLARELCTPLDLPGAAKVIAAGNTRRIDIARANGCAFINNASVGLYPAMVMLRDEDLKRHKVPKWVAAVPASFAVLKRMRHHRMRLKFEGADRDIVTPMLFVGNNLYSLEAGHVGEREALDDGKLSVFAVASRRRVALIGFALRALVGRADPQRDFAAIGETAAFTLDGASRDIHIALDGEVEELTLPIAFEIEPGALTVVASPRLSAKEGSPKSRG